MSVDNTLPKNFALNNSKLLSVFPLLGVFSAFIGFFSIPTAVSIADYSFRAEANLALMQASMYLVIFFLIIKWAEGQIKFDLTNLILLCVLISLVLSSYAAHGRLVNFAVIQFCVLAVVIFSKITFEFNERVVDFALSIFVGLNSVAAIFYFIDPSFFIFPVKVFDSFRGFSFDRVELSFLLACFLCYAIYRRRFLTGGLIFFLVVLTESRSGILSVFLIILFYSSSKYRIIILLSTIMMVPILFMISSRADDLMSVSQRVQLALVALDYDSGSIKRIVFGSGALYSNINGWVPHNNIIQTYLNFGIVGLVANILFVFFLLTKISRKNFGILLVYIVFGLSHQDLEIFSYTVENIVWLAFFLSLRGAASYRNAISNRGSWPEHVHS